MTISVQDWLPANALESKRFREAVTHSVNLWARTWFATVSLDVSRLATADGAAPKLDADLGWVLGQQSIAVHCSKRTRRRLAGMALDVRPGDYPPTDIDVQLLDRFERKLLDDLLVRLGTSLRAPATPAERRSDDPFGGYGGAIVSVSDRSGVVLSIAIPRNAAASWCRPTGAPRGSSKRLQNVLDAVGATRLSVEATLGSAEISVSDLRDLGLGDVLVLNSALSDQNPVCLARGGTVVAKARLTEVDGGIALAVQGA